MSYLLFITKPSGYELAEREGEPPQPGERIEVDAQQYAVAKVASSPLPGDQRRCAYLQGV
jgi:hypothetical protein